VKASPALEGVRSGRLDVNGYVDAKVEAATAHLAHLTAAQRKVVGDVVRQQLLSDPHLADLVRQATGVEPPKADE
jgi:predicted regulator of amino acid metabolism with ACT domain